MRLGIGLGLSRRARASAGGGGGGIQPSSILASYIQDEDDDIYRYEGLFTGSPTSKSIGSGWDFFGVNPLSQKVCWIETDDTFHWVDEDLSNEGFITDSGLSTGSGVYGSDGNVYIYHRDDEQVKKYTPAGTLLDSVNVTDFGNAAGCEFNGHVYFVNRVGLIFRVSMSDMSLENLGTPSISGTPEALFWDYSNGLLVLVTENNLYTLSLDPLTVQSTLGGGGFDPASAGYDALNNKGYRENSFREVRQVNMSTGADEGLVKSVGHNVDRIRVMWQ